MVSLHKVVVIPTYWGRSGGVQLEGDAVYDHPTSVDEDGTLKQVLESLNIIKDDFTLLLIVVPVQSDLNNIVEQRIKTIVSSVKSGHRVSIFLPSYLNDIYPLFEKEIPDIRLIVNLNGYSSQKPLHTPTILSRCRHHDIVGRR